MAKINLDLSDVKPAGMSKTDYIPDGKYNMKIADIEMKETKSGYGLSFYFEVTDGPELGKVVHKYLTAVNSNSQQNEQISKGYIKSILISCGASNSELLADTNDIIGKALAVTVKTKVEEYDGNKIEKSDPVKFSVPLKAEAAPDKIPSSDIPPTNGAAKAAKKKPWE